MALTYTLGPDNARDVGRGVGITAGKLSLDGDYPAGGYDISKLLAQVSEPFALVVNSAKGYTFSVDLATKRLHIWQSSGSSGAGSSHEREHALTNPADHTAVPANVGELLKGNDDGLPVSAGIAATDAADAVSKRHSNAGDHAREHGLTSTSDHTAVPANVGNLLKGDTNGLPAASSVSEAAASAAVSASHSNASDHPRQHAVDSASDHTPIVDPYVGNLFIADANGLPVMSPEYSPTNIPVASHAINEPLQHSGLGTPTANRVLISDANGLPALASAITAGRALISNTNGIPTHNSAALTQYRILTGGSSGNIANAAAQTANRVLVTDANGLPVSNAALTQYRMLVGDANGLPSNADAQTANRVLVTDTNGKPVSNTALTANRMVVADSNGLPANADAQTENRILLADANGKPVSAGLLVNGNLVSADANTKPVNSGVAVTDVRKWTDADYRFPLADRWYCASLYNNLAATTVENSGYIYANPMIVKKSIRIRLLGMKVTTAVAGCTFKFGVYADNGSMYPGTKLYGSGSVSAATLGMKYDAVDFTLTHGLYWLVFYEDYSDPQWLGVSGQPLVQGLISTNNSAYGGYLKEIDDEALPTTFYGGAYEMGPGGPAVLFNQTGN